MFEFGLLLLAYFVFSLLAKLVVYTLLYCGSQNFIWV